MNNTLSYKGYSASMQFDTEDKVIVGRVLDIDDVIVFHGESVREFEQAFHAALDDYLDACRTLEQAPEKPASGRFLLRVAPEVHAAAIRAAARKGLSLNKWAEQALDAAVRRGSGRGQAAGRP